MLLGANRGSDTQDFINKQTPFLPSLKIVPSPPSSIHPKQIAALNEVFTPNEAQIAHARKIINAFAEADTGLVVVDGKLIEKPVLREMNRILTIAEKVQS